MVLHTVWEIDEKTTQNGKEIIRKKTLLSRIRSTRGFYKEVLVRYTELLAFIIDFIGIMANGTIAFDTLQTSGQIDGTARSIDTDYLLMGTNKAWSNIVYTVLHQ